jgi:hypothetical protein
MHDQTHSRHPSKTQSSKTQSPACRRCRQPHQENLNSIIANDWWQLLIISWLSTIIELCLIIYAPFNLCQLPPIIWEYLLL